MQAISEWKNWNGMYDKLRLHLVLFRVGQSPSYIYVSLWQKYINLNSIKIKYIHPNSFYHYPCPPLRAIKMLAVERGVQKYFKLLWWTLFFFLVTATFLIRTMVVKRNPIQSYQNPLKKIQFDYKLVISVVSTLVQ